MTTEIEAYLTGSQEQDDERTDATLSGLGAVGVKRVSATQIGQYQRCPRQWAYRYVMGLKIAPDGGLVVGSGVHHAAEVGMLAKVDTGTNPDPDDSAEAAAQYVSEQVRSGEVRMEDDDPGGLTDRAVRISRAWASEAAPLVMPEQVEQTFNVTMSGIPVTGRMDVVTATSVVDWKTSGKSPNPDDVLKAIQSSIYARATGKPLSFIYLVNQVKAVKVKPIDITQPQSDEIGRLAEFTVGDVAEGMALGVWPRNRNGWHCSKRWCGYYDRCMKGADDTALRERAAEARGAAGVMW
jgi:CRISPR/Cas system-associated exonuclease Cas4 (RecB family)